MKHISLYNEEQLEKLLKLQQKHSWDLELAIPWKIGVDLSLPLVMMDREAFFYPGASAEERLTISQMMGLIIAACIFELEESLIRLRPQAFEQVYRRYPVSPEFRDLGEQFFVEEIKHSHSFKRYVEQFAHTVGVELSDLMKVLPVIEKTKSEFILKKHLEQGGQSFWWIVAIVEQHFLLIFKNLAPHKSKLDPLYFTLHAKHFEEEARHASFPYLMLELLKGHNKSFLNNLFNRYDLMVAQFIQSAWAVSSLSRTREVEKLAHKHEFFAKMHRIEKKHGSNNLIEMLWKLMTKTPYVAPLLNPNGHPKILDYAKEHGALSTPFPDCDEDKLVG